MVKRLTKADRKRLTKAQQAKQRSTMHRRQVLKKRKQLAAESAAASNEGDGR